MVGKLIAEVLDLSAPREAGLAINPNHRVYEWSRNGYSVYFSATSHGDAMSIHLAANKKSHRCLRLAVNEFCAYIFDQFKWCDVILGAIVPASVVNLAKKCGFTYMADAEIHTGEIAAIYSRSR